MANVHWRAALTNWQTSGGELPYTFEGLRLAALMEIRAELQKLNSVMQCRNVAKGFSALAKIARRDEQAFKRRVEHAVAKRLKRSKP